ncbi:hypothetical protein B9Z55_005245 [Caenorhabditis nigoni]|uniref:C2H2-type domain-containing protein n=1 Tax=Caenorhabditis nigoni TaxID=1611254 RepID=A0A2G5V007_9PELO|nr:hypothetical protein B9Z55_005245 [Caenorhabditis nigoni]
MEINETTQKFHEKRGKLFVANDCLSKSSDGTIDSSLEPKGQLVFEDGYGKEFESLKRGKRKKRYNLELVFLHEDAKGFSIFFFDGGEEFGCKEELEDGELSFGDSDDAVAAQKRELTRQNSRFRRFRHKEYQCDECDRMFTLKHNLQNHFVQYHMGCKTLHKACPSCKCTICGKIYSAASVLAEHMMQEHDRYMNHLQCTKCHAQFLTQTDLQKHMKEHIRERKSCRYEQCKGLKFKNSRELAEHVRLEHKTRELSCSVCNMEFRQLSAKIKHEKGHEKEKCGDNLAYRGRERRKAKCDEDLVKREPTSPLSPSPMKRHKFYSPQFEAVPIKRKTTKRLTKEEILAKIRRT